MYSNVSTGHLLVVILLCIFVKFGLVKNEKHVLIWIIALSKSQEFSVTVYFH